MPSTPTIDEYYGSVLDVKDPDGIAVEIFHREGHPETMRLGDVRQAE